MGNKLGPEVGTMGRVQKLRGDGNGVRFVVVVEAVVIVPVAGLVSVCGRGRGSGGGRLEEG